MVLLIPNEFKKHINKISGYITYNSEYGDKNFKYLFISTVNEKFLANQVYRLLLNQKYIDTVNSDTQFYMNSNNFNNIKLLFKKNKPFIYDIIRSFMIKTKMPYFEDHINKNPVDILNTLNTDFILTTSKSIIQNPSIIENDYYDINPDTGKKDLNFKGFGSSSYSSGYWEPEKLFTDTKNNRDNPYWLPRESSFTVRPPNAPFSPRENHYKENMSNYGINTHYVDNTKTGESSVDKHKYADNNYGYDTLEQTLLSKDPVDDSYHDYVNNDNFTNIDALGPGPGNKYMYDYYGDYTNTDKDKRGFSGGGTFPRWQYSMNNRHYDRSSEGLREGGKGDRRVNFARKYDMSSLLNKSTY